MTGSLVFLLALASLGGCDEGYVPEEDLCHRNGEFYAIGTVLVEGCVSCTCMEENRRFNCEEIPECGGCDVEGTYYSPGESWPKGDGCNLCSCKEADTVECTDAPCGG